MSAQAYPVGLIVDDDLRRSRLTVAFRLILVIPHLVMLWLYSIAVIVVIVIAWVITIFRGRVPEGMHEFLAGFVRYTTQIYAYLGILVDPFPPFAHHEAYEATVKIDGPLRQNRLTVFFRPVLVIPPLFLLGYVFDPLFALVGVVHWFSGIVLGRVPAGTQRFGLWLLRFRLHTQAYYLLVNPRYPAFGDKSAPSLETPALPPAV